MTSHGKYLDDISIGENNLDRVAMRTWICISIKLRLFSNLTLQRFKNKDNRWTLVLSSEGEGAATYSCLSLGSLSRNTVKSSTQLEGEM